MTQKFDVLLFSLFPETLTLSSSCRLLLPDRGVQVPDTEVQRNSKQGVLLAAVPGLHSHCHSHSGSCPVFHVCLGRYGGVQHQSQHGGYSGACVSLLLLLWLCFVYVCCFLLIFRCWFGTFDMHVAMNKISHSAATILELV